MFRVSKAAAIPPHILAKELAHHAFHTESGGFGHFFVHYLTEQFFVGRHLRRGVRAEHLPQNLHLALPVGSVLFFGVLFFSLLLPGRSLSTSAFSASIRICSAIFQLFSMLS